MNSIARNPKPETGVLLLNLGGPETPDQIQPYLYELFSDPEIIQLPLGGIFRKPFARWMSGKRAEKVKAKYLAIGGSPMIGETRKQAQALAKILGMPTDFAMRYLNPRISDAIKNLISLGASRLVVIPLFPQYSRTTSGSVIAEFKKQNSSLPYIIIKDHHNSPGYITALGSGLNNALKDLDPSLRSHLLFTAHSLPEKYLCQGDPYLAQTEETVQLLVRGADTPVRAPYSLAFQSKLGPIKWHGPLLEEELEALAKKGIEQLIVFPVSFAAENLETRFDLDLEFKQKCLQAGIKKFIRIPCPGSSEIYLNALAELVMSRVADKSVCSTKTDQWESPDA